MWTTEKEIKQQLEKYWMRGVFLSALIREESLFPLKLKLTKPNSKEIIEHFPLVRKWVEKLIHIDFIQIKWKTIQHRILGEQKVPDSIWIENLESVIKVLKKTKEYQAFLGLVHQTELQNKILLSWIEKSPFKALSVHSEWQKILDVVDWMSKHPKPNIYLRQVDIPNIHTKFIEQHRAIFAELFDLVLPETAINQAFSGVNQFNLRYGFLEKAEKVRFRSLDRKHSIFPNILQSDVTLDAESFAQLKPDIHRIIIVENETTYLSLPDIDDTWAIWGAGYGWQPLAKANWLDDCKIYYWGDLDSHGFVILDQVRERFPQTISFLMDQATLLNYADFWSQDTKAKKEKFQHLTPDEYQLYQALQTDKFGDNVRLEQEFIPFSVVKKVLASLA